MYLERVSVGQGFLKWIVRFTDLDMKILWGDEKAFTEFDGKYAGRWPVRGRNPWL